VAWQDWVQYLATSTMMLLPTRDDAGRAHPGSICAGRALPPPACHVPQPALVLCASV
jgi:hypothetical protein